MKSVTFEVGITVEDLKPDAVHGFVDQMISMAQGIEQGGVLFLSLKGLLKPEVQEESEENE